jgi:Tol biopolymer transport system component
MFAGGHHGDDEPNELEVHAMSIRRRARAGEKAGRQMRHGSLRVGVIVTVVLALLVGAGVASANFKGSNGLIAFDSWTGTSQDIGVFDPSGGGAPTMLTSTPDFYEQTPRWSPDGSKIVYMGHPQYVGSRSVTDIWVMDADGGNAAQLTHTPRREEVPAWTADGRIAYCGQAADDLDNWDIYLMNADGSGLQQLTSSPDFDCWPSPAPAGNKLAFTSTRDGDIGIFTMKLDGSGVRRVTAGFQSDWAPGGNDLVFIRDDDDGSGDVWAAHSDGSGLTQLTDTPETESFPSWSPDGDTVVFGRIVASGVFNIFGLDPVSGDEQLLLADSPPATSSVAYPTWQPLGNH